MSNANPYPAPAPEPVSRVDRYLQRIVDRTVPPVTWRDYQHRVRAGTVGSFAKAGDKLDVNVDGVAKAFDVEGIDEEAPVAPGLDHCLSLIPRPVLFMLPFDPVQFLFAVTEGACREYGWDPAVGMPPGDYCLGLDHGAYNGGTDQDGPYGFSITQAIPVGGGIRHSAIGGVQNAVYTREQIFAGTFTTYGADRLTAIENDIATTDGETGTNLGTTSYIEPQYKNGAYLNYCAYHAGGAPRWSTSWLRQWLNSDEDVFTFRPATIWSRPASGVPVTKGFLRMLDPELRAVLGKVRKRYALGVDAGYGYEDVEDTVTLATTLDIQGWTNNSIYEGPVDSLGTVTRNTAKNLWRTVRTSNDTRKKYYPGSFNPVPWWLGSRGAIQTKVVTENEMLSNGAGIAGFSAYGQSGVVPQLHIV